VVYDDLDEAIALNNAVPGSVVGDLHHRYAGGPRNASSTVRRRHHNVNIGTSGAEAAAPSAR